MAKFNVITIGGVVNDFTFFTDEAKFFSTPENLTAQKMVAFEYGAKIMSNESWRGLGGGAANSAAALAKLGLKVAILARVGNDSSGREIMAQLKSGNIGTRLIQVDKTNYTGYSFIVITDKKEREHVAFLDRGANNQLKILPKELSSVSADWFYITSLTGNHWLNNLNVIFDRAEKKGTKIFWNPGSIQLKAGKRKLAKFLERVTVLALNKDEAIELVLSGIKLGRKDPNHLNRPIYLLNILKEWGPKIIIVTGGKKGSWVYDGKKIYRETIRKTEVKDTTGVGDSFNSTFLAGYICNQANIAKALRWSMINAGSVVTQVGAQKGLLTRRELLNKIK